MKTCCTCRLAKPLDEFYKDKRTTDGLYPRCKPCHNAATKASREKKIGHYRKVAAEHASAKRAADPEANRAYQREHKRKQYLKDPTKAKAAAAKFRAANPEKTAAWSKRARDAKPDYMPQYLADYYARNSEAIKARVRERAERLREELKPVNAARAMRRIVKKRSATPPWADEVAIRAFYLEAARLTKETGVEHQVDHVIPLQGKTVTGLHVHTNLQVLPKAANQSKGNRWGG